MIGFAEIVSGAVSAKQVSLATGVASPMLAVTGVSLIPVRQPVGHVWASVQLFSVPRAPPVHEESAPGGQLSMNAPPQSVPLYGLPETFVAVHWPAAGGDGVPTPQTLATPARPQISGAVQAPHVRVPPQPFGIVPQFLPCAAQVVGVQA